MPMVRGGRSVDETWMLDQRHNQATGMRHCSRPVLVLLLEAANGRANSKIKESRAKPDSQKDGRRLPSLPGKEEVQLSG
jgi:hypothetical protein